MSFSVTSSSGKTHTAGSAKKARSKAKKLTRKTGLSHKAHDMRPDPKVSRKAEAMGTVTNGPRPRLLGSY